MVRFVGEILQVPPMVSARKVEGRRLYELAREGKTIEREARPVTITGLEMLGFAPSDYPELTFRVRCSTGTYIRTLADDIARALGGRAHLSALRRTAIGSLSVDAATQIGGLSAESWADRVITPADALGDMPAVVLGEELAKAVRNGMSLAGPSLGSPARGLVRLLDDDGRLLAVYRSDGNRASAEVVLS